MIRPARTEGGTRRYSQDDVDRLRRVSELMDAGLNLAGVALVLDLQDQNEQLRQELARRDGERAADRRVGAEGLEPPAPSL